MKEIFIFVVNFFKFLVAEGSLTDPVHEQFVTYDNLYILSSFYFRQMLLNFCNYKVVLKIFIKYTSECFHSLSFFLCAMDKQHFLIAYLDALVINIEMMTENYLSFTLNEVSWI